MNGIFYGCEGNSAGFFEEQSILVSEKDFFFQIFTSLKHDSANVGTSDMMHNVCINPLLSQIYLLIIVMMTIRRNSPKVSFLFKRERERKKNRFSSTVAELTKKQVRFSIYFMGPISFNGIKKKKNKNG